MNYTQTLDAEACRTLVAQLECASARDPQNIVLLVWETRISSSPSRSVKQSGVLFSGSGNLPSGMFGFGPFGELSSTPKMPSTTGVFGLPSKTSVYYMRERRCSLTRTIVDALYRLFYDTTSSAHLSQPLPRLLRTQENAFWQIYTETRPSDLR